MPPPTHGTRGVVACHPLVVRTSLQASRAYGDADTIDRHRGNRSRRPTRLRSEDAERNICGVNLDDDFSNFVAARWPRLVRSAVLLGCSEAEAEDLVQSMLERCLVKWRVVQRAENRDAYIHRALINTLTSARRRRWTGENPTADLPDLPGADVTTGVDDTDVVMRALDRLPDDQRIAVVLRYYVHLSEHEMSATLGVAPGTVKSRLARARMALARDPDLAQL